MIIEPRESAFNYPAFRQHDKSANIDRVQNDLQTITKSGFNPFDDFSAIITVNPDFSQLFAINSIQAQQFLESVAVLDASRRHHNGHYQTERVNQQMPFPALNLFARVETARGNKSGTISEIKIIMNGGKPDVFLPVKPPFDSPQQLAKYAGIYYSDEFDADYKLTLKGNNLVLQIGENFEDRLTVAYADYFTIRGGVVNISFTRDDKGKIAGFVFNVAADGREVKGITFKRQ